MRRVVVSTLVLGALVACANGGTPDTVEQQQTSEDGGPSGPSIQVPPGSQDDDHDG